MADRTPRETVYAAVDSEADYQDSRWGRPFHSIAEWLIYIDDYVRQAKTQVTRGVETEEAALETIRKITTMGVRCMEQHGAPLR